MAEQYPRWWCKCGSFTYIASSTTACYGCGQAPSKGVERWLKKNGHVEHTNVDKEDDGWQRKPSRTLADFLPSSLRERPIIIADDDDVQMHTQANGDNIEGDGHLDPDAVQARVAKLEKDIANLAECEDLDGAISNLVAAKRSELETLKAKPATMDSSWTIQRNLQTKITRKSRAVQKIASNIEDLESVRRQVDLQIDAERELLESEQNTLAELRLQMRSAIVSAAETFGTSSSKAEQLLELIAQVSMDKTVQDPCQICYDALAWQLQQAKAKTTNIASPCQPQHSDASGCEVRPAEEGPSTPVGPVWEPCPQPTASAASPTTPLVPPVPPPPRGLDRFGHKAVRRSDSGGHPPRGMEGFGHRTIRRSEPVGIFQKWRDIKKVQKSVRRGRRMENTFQSSADDASERSSSDDGGTAFARRHGIDMGRNKDIRGYMKPRHVEDLGRRRTRSRDRHSA